jgi:hypothetical protein
LTTFDLACALEGVSEPEPTILRRSDGLALLYPGAMNWLHGPPSCGKTWLALAALADVVGNGGRAVFLDYEDGPGTVAARLIALGVSIDALGRVRYVQASGPIGDGGIAWLLDRAEQAALVVLDSAPESLAAEGGDENSSGDVARWVARLPRRLARAGAAVFVIDHVTKDTAARGQWARGSGHKLAAVDGVALSFEEVLPFSRAGSGTAQLVVAKDRRGYVGAARQVVAEVRFEVEAGSLREIVIAPPDDATRAAPEPEPPATAISPEDVVLALEAAGRSWRSTAVAGAALGIGKEATAAVLRAAVEAGYVVEEPGTNGAKGYRLVEHAGEASQGPLLDLAAERRRREGP